MGSPGLSTAYHLGDRPHLVLEAERTPGGLCRSREVDGFVFDYTGHLLHLRDARIVALVDDAPARSVRRRSSAGRAIRTAASRLPFPFQANLHGLPKEIVADCLIAFVETLGQTRAATIRDDRRSRSWSLAVFGRGISDGVHVAVQPQAVPARAGRDDRRLGVVGGAQADARARSCAARSGSRTAGMGYNATLPLPARGGIGVLPAALAAARAEHCGSARRGRAVDLDRRVVVLGAGERLRYDAAGRHDCRCRASSA